MEIFGRFIGGKLVIWAKALRFLMKALAESICPPPVIPVRELVIIGIIPVGEVESIF